jgi:hypothetical protein
MAAKKIESVTIRPLNMQTIKLTLIGESPLVLHKFGARKKNQIRATQESSTGSKRKKDPRDFEADFQDAMYVSEEGWYGVHAAAFRCACVSACRVSGAKMTVAKLSVFIEQDGIDVTEGTPLVKIHSPEDPECWIAPVRNATGVVDLRARPMWRRWQVNLRVRFDADQFTADDVVNLINRVGQQVGIGEGRPDSKKSCGMGFGLFRIKTSEEEKPKRKTRREVTS